MSDNAKRDPHVEELRFPWVSNPGTDKNPALLVGRIFVCAVGPGIRSGG